MNKICLSILLLFQFQVCPIETPEDASTQAEYVLVMDRNTGQILYDKNAEARIYPASLTKMLSEIIAIEELPDIHQTIEITGDAWMGVIEANASYAGFSIHDEPTVEDLLYGIALPSGAEAVNALALEIDGSIEAFVNRMNQKAEEIGMMHSHFENPTGLHHENHYSTCMDLAILLDYCLKNPLFRTIFSTESYITSPITSHPSGLQLNSTSLIFAKYSSYDFPGLIGAKTGFTNPAGRCLASYSELNEMELITIVAKSPYDQGALIDTSSILTWYNNHYQNYTLLTEGSFVKEIPVLDSKQMDSISVLEPESLSYDFPIGTEITIIQDLPDEIIAPMSKGEQIGTYSIYANQEKLTEGYYLLESDIPYDRFLHWKRIFLEFHAKHSITIVGIKLLIVLFLLSRIRKKPTA